MSIQIYSVWKGHIPYQKSITLQQEFKKKVKDNLQIFLMGFESPTCITLGLRGKEQDLNQSAIEYQKKSIEIVSIKRGGQATLHSPGQLVIYPVMDLHQHKIRPRDFLSLLELITKDLLKDYNVIADKKETFAGLFTNHGKIAFFGIHISEGISQHGLALNVKNNLNLFKLIRSCGVQDRPHDSLQNQHPSSKFLLEQVFSLWCKKAQIRIASLYKKNYLNIQKYPL